MNLYRWPDVPRRGGLTEADLDAAQRARDVDPWAVTRFADCEPYALNEMQRQAADEKAQSRRYQERLHGTEGCADTSDEPPPRAAGWQLALVYGMSAVASVSFLVAVWPYLRGLL